MAGPILRQVPWAHVHFTGIGGVGMTGLALILRDFGVRVSGSDAAESRNLALLRERGAQIQVGHDAAHLAQPDLLVYSSAVAEDNPERAAAAERNIRTIRRGEFLAELAAFFPTRVAIAGSHGKTTVSAMLSHILIEVGSEPGYMVGGEVAGRAAPAGAGRGEILVTEVDESDGTQARMQSTHALVINAEDDHCWSVGGEDALKQCFRDFAAKADFVLAFESPSTRELFGDLRQAEFFPDSAVRTDLELLLPGRHNRINASLAVRLAECLGVAAADAVASLRTFRGVDRRLSLRYRGPQVLLYEDYAHHPTEVRASLAALREAHPQRRLRLVFQPHRFERVARYAVDFARELGRADEVIVTPTFNAWLDDAHLADPRSIVEQIKSTPTSFLDLPHPELAAAVADNSAAGDVIAVMGAGTITALLPLLTAALTAKGL